MSKRKHPSRRPSVSPLLEPLEARRLLATELVRDIRPDLDSLVAPKTTMTDVNGSVYFIAIYKLWKSDGTEAGTTKVSDTFFYNPMGWSNVDGTLFFNERGWLWKSDGTSQGTVQVLPAVINPSYITAVGSRAFFRASDGAGEELWTSDGTAAGTQRVKDINPGAAGSDVRELINVNGRLFFRARDAGGGDELWTSDGTEAGTYRVKDINPGAGGSEPVSFTNVNGTLFFAARDADDRGYELWKSDGTEAGTMPVKEIRPGKAGSSPTSLRNVNGTLMFVATDGTSGYELWKSDGTEAGTVMVRDLIPGGASPTLDHLTVLGNTLFFTADDESGAGIELWKSDGTASGTVRVKDIAPGATASNPGALTVVGGNLYFVASDGATGYQIWKSDGSAAGTTRLESTTRSSVSKLTASGEKLFFVSPYFVPNVGSTTTLWVSDGTSAGTVARPVVYEGYGVSSNILSIVTMDNMLYFLAEDGIHGREIWKSDGTEAGTSLVVDLLPGWGSYNPTELTNVAGTLFFVAAGKLWKTDGTATGTAALSNTISPTKLKAVGNTLFFAASDSFGQELWKSDGTVEGTARVADIRVGGSAAIDYLTDVNGTAYFIANDGASGHEIWKSDGTPAGTVMVKDILPGAASSGAMLLTNADGALYFRANDGVNGWELWKSDGSPAGTHMVKDIRPGPESSAIHSITAVGGRVYFVADGASGQEVWTSDGTAGGTFMLRDIRPGAHGSSPTNLTEVNGKLMFRADDGVNGAELWISDGSSAGTQLVKDIRPGAATSDLMRFFNVEGKLIFTAYDGIASKLWVSDGTPAGTFPLANDTVYLPTYVTGFGGNLYFVALTNREGYELRRLAVPDSAPAMAAAPSIDAGAVEPAPASAHRDAATAPALAGDIFYDALGRPLEPLAVASSGLPPALVYGSGIYTDATNTHLDETRLRALARQADTLGQPLILDIEHWPIDNRFATEGIVQVNLEKMMQAADWVHDERPGVTMGFYALTPLAAYPAPAPGVGSWHAANERIRPLIDKVDELYPYLYSFNPWQAQIWRAGAENMIAEARLYGKPVRPFYWPQYSFNPDQSGRLLPANVWRMELDTAHDLADGAILWDSGPQWIDNAPWWTVTRDFLIDPTPIAPATPANLGAAVQNAQRVNLSWTDKSYNESGWRVQRRLGTTGPFVDIATLDANTKSYADQSVSAASSYTYRVIAFNAGGDSLASNQVFVTTPPGNVPPAAPVDPKAVGLGPALIRVSWIPGSQNHGGFKIERAAGGGNFVQVGTAAADATHFDDATVALGVEYLYRIRAHNAFGDSAYSQHTSGSPIASAMDLRARWKLDDAAGTSAADSSGGERHGTVLGGAVWTSGALGGALSFDGVDGHVVVADAPALRFTGDHDFTFSAKVNLTALPNKRVAVVSRGGTGIFIDASNRWTFGGESGDITGSVASTGWRHVAIVQSAAGGWRKLYINGVEVASGAVQDASAAGDLWFGGNANNGGEFFAGRVDDVRVYGKAWSAADLATLAAPMVALNGTAGDDIFSIDIDPLTDRYRMIVNGSTVATPLREAVAGVSVVGGAGDDVLTIDSVGGNPLPEYGLHFEGGSGRDTLKIAGNQPNAAFSATASAIARGMTAMTYGSVEELTLAAASMSVDANLGMAFKAEAGGVATFTTSQKLTDLVFAGGQVDVGTQHVAIDYTGDSSLSQISAAVSQGRNGGQWNGSGIITSAPAAKAGLTTLVPVEAASFLNISGSQTASWFGMTVDATTVLLIYAWAGDANFDGAVDGDDYFFIDSGFSAQSSGWGNGDFDLNGRIDADDYFIIDRNYGKGGALPMAAADVSSPPSAGVAFYLPAASPFAEHSIDSAYERLVEEQN